MEIALRLQEQACRQNGVLKDCPDEKFENKVAGAASPVLKEDKRLMFSSDNMLSEFRYKETV
jgi:hypothetical protein